MFIESCWEKELGARDLYQTCLPRPTLQPLAVCAALAPIIKSTCESFERGKERIDWEKEKTQDGEQ